LFTSKLRDYSGCSKYTESDLQREICRVNEVYKRLFQGFSYSQVTPCCAKLNSRGKTGQIMLLRHHYISTLLKLTGEW